MVDVTIVDPASVGKPIVQVPLLIPHELFGALYAASPGVWIKAVLGFGGPEAISDFWERLAHMEWVRRHPALSAWGSRCTAVPIGFHGDGAQFTREESMTALTWSSVMATGASLDSRFLIAALPTTWLAPGTWMRSSLSWLGRFHPCWMASPHLQTTTGTRGQMEPGRTWPASRWLVASGGHGRRAEAMGIGK